MLFAELRVRSVLDAGCGDGSRYLLATTFVGDRANEDICLGGWRPIDLERPPFGLGPPLHLISEGTTVEDGRYANKSLGLWNLQVG